MALSGYGGELVLERPHQGSWSLSRAALHAGEDGMASGIEFLNQCVGQGARDAPHVARLRWIHGAFLLHRG